MSALRSGQLAAVAGVNPQTLRYYERRGLLQRPARTPGGHRLYPKDAVTVLQVIKAAQRLGFTLDEVAALLEARTRPGGPDLRTRAGQKLAEVEARIAELQQTAAVLRAALAAGCEDLVACAHTPRCPLPIGDRDGRPTAGE